MKNKFIFLLITILFCSCKSDEVKLPAQFVALPFTNEVIDTEEMNILKYLYFYNGAGVAVADLVGDDLPDIFLVSNQGENQLLENKGNFEFEAIEANVSGLADWQTGVAVVDINNDGFNDIYVCAVSGIHGFEGKNELYINNQDGSFTERAAEYGLDFQDFCTAVAFLDYDRDGDLDMYLLNHAVHTEDGYRLPADVVRNKVSESSGDRLLRNDGDQFIDVSKEADIIRGKVSYGLAVKVADINRDGWPDIYVSNDFHENDYLYLNQGDGSFMMATDNLFRYTTKYSMGNDIADVNGDQWPDVFVADMEPWDEEVKKTTQSEDSPEIFAYKQNFGYTRQYARNTLQLNDGGNRFYDVAQQYEVGASDWSWSPILEDFNQDGKVDLFISNGIWRRPNDLDFLNYISSETIKKQLNQGSSQDLAIIENMPQGLVPNQFYLQKEHGFELASDEMGFTFPDQSTGTATGDLDGDGDLDIVINRLNAPAIIWRNQFAAGNSFIVDFEEPSKAYGTKVDCFIEGKQITKELYPQRGFMSQSQPILHFGIGENQKPDSIRIAWPDGSLDVIDQFETNGITISQHANQKVMVVVKEMPNQDLRSVYHPEDFTAKPLLPYKGFDLQKEQTISKDALTLTLRPFKALQIKKDGETIKHDAPLGLWQTASFIDKDGDGDLDILLGNLGNNHRLTASMEHPMRLYIKDFDQNGDKETIWAVYKTDGYYPLFHKDDITKQLVLLKKEYNNYKSFAGKKMDEIFGESLKDAQVLEIEDFANGWLIQENEQFEWQALPFELQQGPITVIEPSKEGWNVSGKLDIFAPYIGYLELPNYEWIDGNWKKN